MRIRNIAISRFGGLKDFHIDFEDGLNTVYGENENGKTTIMSFIKMMFYGSGRAVGQISKDIRKKYTPWDGSQMAGAVEFEHNGRHYRLEREFRNSNSTDRLNLRDLDLGTSRNITGGEIGSTFFGLSAAAFERSVFIGQFGSSEKDDTAAGEINGKLSNLALTGNESTSFDTVKTRLEKARLSLMSKSGRAGDYDKNLAALKVLEQRITEAEDSARVRFVSENKIEELKARIAAIEKRRAQLKQVVESEQMIRKAGKLRELLSLKEELERIKSALRLSDGGIADEMFISGVNFALAKIEKTKDKIADRESELESLKSSISLAENSAAGISPEKRAELEKKISELGREVTRLESEYENSGAEIAECESSLNEGGDRQKDRYNIFLAAFILLIIVGAALAAVKLFIMALIPAAAGTISLVLFFALPRGGGKGISDTQSRILNLRSAQSRLKSEIAVNISLSGNLNSQLEMAKNSANSTAAILKEQRNRAALCKSQLEGLQEELERENAALLKLYHKLDPKATTHSIYNDRQELAKRAEQIKSVKTRLNYVSADLGNISYEQAGRYLEEMGDSASSQTTNFEAVHAEYDAVLKELSSTQSLLAVAESQMKSAVRTAENPALLKTERLELVETLKSQKNFCDAAEYALQVLSDSFAAVRRSYGSVLEKRAAEIFTRITGGRYAGMNVSKSLDIQVEQSGVFGSREIDYLSSGTADQAYISLRLALSSLMSESGEGLPVMLDDTLTQYDDQRMNQTIEFLKEYSSDYQIIMFTCHRAVYEAAKKSGAAVTKLDPISEVRCS